MAGAVYLLSAFISFVCTILLLRSFAATRTPLLFWVGLGFAGLTLNNALLFVDKIVVTDVDLSLWRTVPALLGMLVLAVGLLWEESA